MESPDGLTRSKDEFVIAPGAVINGRYRVTRKLGAGGFAVVYEAMDEQIERRVAIKVMNVGHLVDDEESREVLLARFGQEAKLAGRIDHPNVLNVFDYGVVESANEPFIVMEFLEGHDLDRELRRNGAMTPERLLPLFRNALVALGVAHDLGIVHKDLKPANLFLKHPGTRLESLNIVDFGIAHLEREVQGRLTQAGQVTGTPGYLAPEYATERIVTPMLDVYQMGLILVEALVGKPVVDHPDPVAAMFQHVRGELAVPAELWESELGPVLVRALALDHKQRYESGYAFADALARVDPKGLPPVSAASSTRTLASLEVGDSDIIASADTADFEREASVDTPVAATRSLYGSPKEANEAVSRTGKERSIVTRLPPGVGPERPEETDELAKHSAGRGGRAPVAVIGAALSLVAVVAVLVMWPAGEEADLGVVAAESAGLAQVEVEPDEEAGDEPGLEEELEEDDAAFISREVSIASEPAGATLLLNGVEVATTPFTLEFEEPLEGIHATLELEGYERDAFTVSYHDDEILRVLEVVASPPPRPRPQPEPSTRRREPDPEPSSSETPRAPPAQEVLLPDF